MVLLGRWRGGSSRSCDLGIRSASGVPALSKLTVG
jgi:hypothetical protein